MVARTGRRRFASFAGPAVLVVSTGAAAEPAGALSPPSVTLKVTPGSGGAPWKLEVANTGEEPVRIPADPRLLSLEITEPETARAPTKKGAKPSAPLRCVLPDDARPPSDEGLELVVPTKRSWSTTFDPLFFCFGARERRALVAGSEVKARFGWPAVAARAGAKTAKAPPLTPPLAVTPVGAAVGKISPAKSIDADPFTLSEAVAVAEAPRAGDAPPGVSLSVPEAMDAARGAELTTTVTLKNEGERPITLLFRPDMLELRITGPSGSLWCGSPRTVDSPIRELFITVAAKGKTETSVLFTASCPAGTFDDPGVYRVLPRLDTTGASGRSIGLPTWEGVAVAKTPLLVRVRTPKSPALPPRARLD